MTREQLVARIRHFEDPFVERKSSPERGDVVAAVVGFANSVRPDREAVLYLGVAPDGRLVGVDNPDPLQRKTNDWLDETYPRVSVRYEVLADLAPRPVLAVIVGASEQRPHFAGPAWVRDGSETKKASPQLYEELIASRNSKAGAILRHKGEVITAVFQRLVGVPKHKECVIEGATAFSVELRVQASGNLTSVSLDRVTITKDPHKHRALKLSITPTPDE